MTFTPNRPVETREPQVVVDAGLPIGTYRFQLVVVGRSGRQSSPVEVLVTIGRFPRPTPLPIPGPVPGPIVIPRS